MMVDHVALGVKDPEETARRFHDAYGLRAVEGVRFDGYPALQNWLVPVGSSYVELVTVVDENAANDVDVVRAFLALVEQGDRWLGWAIHTPEMKAVAERIGLPITNESMEFIRDGRKFTWDLLAFQERMIEPYLPFFLCWDEQEELNRYMQRLSDETGNSRVADGIAGVELSGDSQRLGEWLGGEEPPGTIEAGEPDILGVRLANSDVIVRA